MRTLLIFLALCACASAQPFAPLQYHRTASAAAWKPSDLDSLYVWLQADSIAGKSHGDTVGIWRNAWAAGNVFNTTAAQKPVYYTNIIGGKPVLFFDATDDILQSKANALGYKTGVSSFVVIKYRARGQNVAGVSASAGAYSAGLQWYTATRQISDSFRVYINTNGAQTYVNAASDDTLAHVHAMLYSGSDSLVFWLDAVRYAKPTAVASLSLTDEIDIGCADNAGSKILPINAYIAEIIIYGGRKSNADAKLVRDYLKAKYGTP